MIKGVTVMLEDAIGRMTESVNQYVRKRELIEQIKRTKDDAEHERLLQRLDDE